MQLPIEPIMPLKPKRPITSVSKQGDSLTDSGVLYHRHILIVISLALLSGLKGESPLGRFTNGYVWSDDFDADLANQFQIRAKERGKKDKKHNLNSADVADDILLHRNEASNGAQKRFNAEEPTEISDDILDHALDNDANYNLDSAQTFQYQGRDFVKNYAEGGLTSASYWGLPSTSISRFFARLIVHTLAEKRALLLDDDQKKGLTAAQKAKKLIIEWSGANDLITVNARPSKEIAQKAIAARIANIEELIKHGYQNFALYNLPNLSLTPEYQAKSPEEIQNANEVSSYFNQQLALACDQLQKKYPYFVIKVIDVNKKFEEIYANPQNFGLNPDLKRQPFQNSPDFNNRNRISHDPDGHIFWDHLHPTARVQKLLEVEVIRQLSDVFEFKQPHEVSKDSEVVNLDACELYSIFRDEYLKRLAKEEHVVFFGLFRRSNLHINFKDPNIDPRQALITILNHGLYQKGGRTKEIMKELRWIDDNGNLLLNIPALKAAKQHLDLERSQSESARLLPIPSH